VRLQRLPDVAAEAAGREAHGNAFAAKFFDDARDVDALAAGVEAAGLHAQGVTRDKPRQDQGLVDRRVEAESYYHASSGRIIP
jgi:hypothetical protein